MPAETLTVRRTPELLAPAGDWECAKAAVENGADAIYFGLDRFNARMRAHNFTEADLPELMAFLHRRGVRGYVTFNTLVFTEELPQAEACLRAVIAAGVDAAIVQDAGVCRLIRKLSPDFPIHGSTQMTVTSAAGVEFVRALGCSLVVLARECSIPEIAAIHAATDLPLEVFVHGALCVAYSGQCLTSEALGGRSANRGECAQACRMPYDLLVDGEQVPLGDRRYLLSPQDLAGLDVLPDLARSGVASLKIEGRLKSPEYVAAVTRVYRAALDQLDEPPSPSARYALEMSFSRGLHTGWLGGIDNQRLVHARFGKKRGVLLGEIDRVAGKQALLRLQAPLKPGDGVVFDAGRPDEDEVGGWVQSVQADGPFAAVTLGRNADLSRVRTGDKLWKTSDPALDREVRQTFEGEAPRFQRPVSITVRGRAGTPLILEVTDGRGSRVQLESALPLAPADREPLSDKRLASQLGRLGGTAYALEELRNLLEGPVILPVSELNRLRRAAVIQLDELRSRPPRWTLRASTAPELPPPAAPLAEPQLIALVRSLAQLEAALDCRTIYCDFEDPKAYRLAVERVRSSGLPDATVWVAPPRIFKTGEEWILKQVRSSAADGYLVRNYDGLRFFAGDRCVADFSFNVTNPLTIDALTSHAALERLTVSYDLNAAQVEALLAASAPERLEVTIHQHMPMFHMEHCVFCAFLSKGKDYRDCGRPCDKHAVKLRDRVGQEHPLKADSGCRNTVYNARAQTGAESVDRFRALGLRHFRVEFVNETPAEVGRVLSRYRALLRHEITGADLWRELRLQNQLGVTRGQMEKC